MTGGFAAADGSTLVGYSLLAGVLPNLANAAIAGAVIAR
jgi:hypothetical protein